MKKIQTKVVLSIEDLTVTVGLYDTTLAQEIVNNLPLCIEMESFGGREYCSGELPFVPKSVEEKQTYFDIGDFAYWSKGNALAFFYAKGLSKEVPSGIVVIGRILSDLAPLKNLPSLINVIFKKI